MLRRSFFAALLIALSPIASAESATVEMQTTQGTIVLELYPDKAPATVKNFLSYVNDGYYKDTVFHRVIPNFMIQGGGFTADMDKKKTKPPVQNESIRGLSNSRGTISMARTSNPHSATSQFFINTVDNLNLDGRPGRPGYTVFGKVTKGMNVVDSISAVSTGRRGPYRDVPVEPVVIISAKQL